MWMLGCDGGRRKELHLECILGMEVLGSVNVCIDFQVFPIKVYSAGTTKIDISMQTIIH